jgi:hypothetical protein
MHLILLRLMAVRLPDMFLMPHLPPGDRQGLIWALQQCLLPLMTQLGYSMTTAVQNPIFPQVEHQIEDTPRGADEKARLRQRLQSPALPG